MTLTDYPGLRHRRSTNVIVPNTENGDAQNNQEYQRPATQQNLQSLSRQNIGSRQGNANPEDQG